MVCGIFEYRFRREEGFIIEGFWFFLVCVICVCSVVSVCVMCVRFVYVCSFVCVRFVFRLCVCVFCVYLCVCEFLCLCLCVFCVCFVCVGENEWGGGSGGGGMRGVYYYRGFFERPHPTGGAPVGPPRVTKIFFLIVLAIGAAHSRSPQTPGGGFGLRGG